MKINETLTIDQVNSLINMLNSKDTNDKNIALELINKLDVEKNIGELLYISYSTNLNINFITRVNYPDLGKYDKKLSDILNIVLIKGSENSKLLFKEHIKEMIDLLTNNYKDILEINVDIKWKKTNS
jgi:hypothetical protein